MSQGVDHFGTKRMIGRNDQLWMPKLPLWLKTPGNWQLESNYHNSVIVSLSYLRWRDNRCGPPATQSCRLQAWRFLY